VRLKAPWIKHYYNNSGKFYIIPNVDSIVCGGTLQKDNWSTDVTEVGPVPMVHVAVIKKKDSLARRRGAYD
jgi:hypothetical protein